METNLTKLMVCLVTGLFAFWTLSAHDLPNACGLAGSNLEFIQGKIQGALAAEELQLARYKAYQALNGLEKSKHSLKECGCLPAQELVDRALSRLKEAVKAISLTQAGSLLDQALGDTQKGLEALRAFQETYPWAGGIGQPTDVDGHISQEPDWLPQIPDSTVSDQVEGSLSAFKNSLEGILEVVDCLEAHRYITKIHEETRTTLHHGVANKHKRAYYLRLLVLTEAALRKLGDCGI